MITCNLMGGLGNQLFQIFATISYAIKVKQGFHFLYTEFLGKRQTYWNTFLFPLKGFTSTRSLGNTTILQEQDFGYNELPILQNNEQSISLYGYFQSCKYFDTYYDTICKLIRLKTQQNNITQTYYHNYDKLISMHFRLGDYKLLQEYHPIMTYTYYFNSIQHIISTTNHSELHILYFCEKEDNAIVQETIKELSKAFPLCKFIKAFDTITDWEQMLMMSCCRHNIIANSTFSWWGAYFNGHADKIVCYPNIWFGPKNPVPIHDLFPESWIKLNSA